MSDQPYEYDDEDDEQEQEQEQQPERSGSDWAKLRRAEKARDKAEKELAAMKAEQAFQQAGFAPDDPKAKYFKAGYTGDLTAEAIRAEAIKAGFIAEQVEPEPDQAPIDAAARIAGFATNQDPADMVVAGLDQAFAEGGNEGMLQFLASQGVPVAGPQG